MLDDDDSTIIEEDDDSLDLGNPANDKGNDDTASEDDSTENETETDDSLDETDDTLGMDDDELGDDSGGDGLLTEDEVSRRFWEKIAPADTNDDNAISFEEFENWLEQHVAETPEAIGPAPATRAFDGAFGQLGRRFRGLRR